MPSKEESPPFSRQDSQSPIRVKLHFELIVFSNLFLFTHLGRSSRIFKKLTISFLPASKPTFFLSSLHYQRQVVRRADWDLLIGVVKFFPIRVFSLLWE